jgi:MerR family redox-sensitive transcriptional activator SoxR
MSTQPHEQRTLSVREVADEAGVARSAVRFYERYGLVSATRTSGNQRRFDANAPCLIRVARVAQRVGLTVREIATILESMPPSPEPADWAEVAEHLVEQAEAKITRLRTVLDELSSAQKLCELDPH